MSSRPVYRQSPPKLPVLAMNDIVGGWWCGIPTRCAACGGNLSLTPPLLTTGYISCLSCSREVAEVVDVIRPVVKFADIPAPKQGRPPGIKNTTIPRPPCRNCRERPAKAERRLCGSCIRRREAAG